MGKQLWVELLCAMPCRGCAGGKGVLLMCEIGGTLQPSTSFATGAPVLRHGLRYLCFCSGHQQESMLECLLAVCCNIVLRRAKVRWRGG